jgi:5-methylcytosine-specific restriction protein A
MATALLPHQHHRAQGTVKKTPAHVARVRAAQKRERSKKTTRSPKWRAVRARHLKAHPECAACGSRVGLQVHHIKPFHLAPALELEPSNLVTLCEYVGGLECHEMLGHGDHWQSYTPGVVTLAARLRADPSTLAAVRAEAKATRKRLP